MASLKEVRGRIISVNSTQQITKAMKMVSAAKLRKAQDNITKIRPYAERLNLILNKITASLDIHTPSPYALVRTPEKILLVVITSDRGLAGAFNSNIIKKTNVLIDTQYQRQNIAGNVKLLVIGKRGNDYFAKRKVPVINTYLSSFQNLNFDTARMAAEFTMSGFLSGEFDRVELIYNEFKNVASQIIKNEIFLPIHEVNVSKSSVIQRPSIDYIFEPSKEEIIKELIPKLLKIKFYKSLLDSNASEHGARMTAMDKATDNAKELLKELKLTYNRTRQAAITKEILEIVGGAEALNG